MTTLIDRIMNNQKMIQIVNQLQIWDDDIIREILEAELTAVNGVDELIEKKLEEWDNRKPTDYLNVPWLLINIAKNDLKALKQIPVASECKHEYPDWDIKYPCCLCWKIEKPTTEEIIKDSQPKEVDELEKYKQYCIWPYQKWDVIEVLIANDIDDWYNHQPQTRYYYVVWQYISLVWQFEENTTWKIVNLQEYKTTFSRKSFWDILDVMQFDSSYIIWHRKIEIENHMWWKPKTKEREEIKYIEYT